MVPSGYRGTLRFSLVPSGSPPYEEKYVAGRGLVPLCNIRLGSYLTITIEPNPNLNNSNTIYTYHHSDHLGSASVMTDFNGNLSQHYGYSPFGTSVYEKNTSLLSSLNSLTGFDISNRFTGQILDEETDLYYYGARYYDPFLARFVQADSIIPNPGNSQALNRYSYCYNNPLKFNDPSGHAGEEPGLLFSMYTGMMESLTNLFSSNSNPSTGEVISSSYRGAVAGANVQAYGNSAQALSSTLTGSSYSNNPSPVSLNNYDFGTGNVDTQLFLDRLENDKLGLALDGTQTTLDLAGYVDPTPTCDLINTGISLGQGNYQAAAISAVAILPIVGDSAKIGTKVISRPVAEVNAAFIAKGWEAPYAGKLVREFAAPEDMVDFVRVHGDKNMVGNWMMRSKDVQGLTAEQIKDRFALPALPKFISNVYVPQGTLIRAGKVNAVEKFGGNGGAYQYELLNDLQEINYMYTREIK
ncbi:MAG: RHS repeat-associated core domain-containing protein [Sedimentisphaerales bacterium]|nr:RHS repeat-associated core domain-containing protein [Sedimentisphaerales bacterium]